MKKTNTMTRITAILIFMIGIISEINSQTIKTTSDLEDFINSSLIFDDSYSDSLQNLIIDNLKIKFDSIKNSPESYNKIWTIVVEKINNQDSTLGKWLNDLNIDIKTFQSQDTSTTSIGFSYDLNIEKGKIKEKKKLRNGTSIAFESVGNVAFNKDVNPSNFLNSKLSINKFHTGGGILLKDISKVQDTLQDLRMKMADYKTADEVINSNEWKSFNTIFSLKNSWILKYDINAGFESNQDFSEKQYTAGVRLGLSIKSWNENDLISWLNIFDYPFALTRMLTNYNIGFNPAGSTLPSILFAFDIVNPLNDTIREQYVTELELFPRTNLEIGFRTIFGKINNQVFYFNSSLRYYYEIGASIEIKEAGLEEFFYFTSSISSTHGFYISYSIGQLPFDRKDEAVYELGFKYNFK